MIGLIVTAFSIGLIILLIFIPIKVNVRLLIDILNLEAIYHVTFGFLTLDAATLTICKTGVNQTRKKGKEYFISYLPCRTRGYFEGVFGNEVAKRSRLKIGVNEVIYGDMDNPNLTTLFSMYTTPVFTNNTLKVDVDVKVKTTLKVVFTSLYIAIKKYLKAA